MAGKDVLTTRVGEHVKVEINDPTNPYGTVPNYGTVKPVLYGNYHWQVASGESGTEPTERRAINATARAIREHAARQREATAQQAYAHVPAAVVEAVNKVIEHYGEKMTKPFYSADGEAIVHYRTELGSGVGSVHFVHSGQDDGWVLAMHTVPGHVEGGLPGRFNANVMYDTATDWWPTEQD